MKFKSLFFSVIFLASVPFVSSLAFAGNEGHGGGAVVCRDRGQKIKSIQLLDLYEAGVLYGLKVTSSRASVQEQIDQRLNDLDHARPHYSDFIRPFIELFQMRMRFAPPNTVLQKVTDAYEVVMPVGCQLEQVVNYLNDNLILVQKDLWQALDQTNRAALSFHEGLYRELRGGLTTSDSRRTRRIVGHLFADFKFEKVSDHFDDALFCATPAGPHYTDFYVTGDEKTGRTFEFSTFDGQEVISKKTGFAFLDRFPQRPYNLAHVIFGTERLYNFGLNTKAVFEGSDYLSFQWKLINGVTKLLMNITWGSDAMQTLPEQEVNCLRSTRGAETPSVISIEEGDDAASFGGPGLSVRSLPARAVLIPAGSTTIGRGHFKLQGPYFILSGLNIIWNSKHNLDLQTIRFRSLDARVDIQCNFGGDDLKYFLPNSVTSDGLVMLSGISYERTQPFGCSGLTFNGGVAVGQESVPLEVEVSGIEMDELSGDPLNLVKAKGKLTLE